MVPSNALRKAAVQALRANAPLMALVTGVYENVPDNQPLPYVQVGEAHGVPMNAFAAKGHETTITFHVWSGYPGYHEALTILDALDTALDHTDLALDPPHKHIGTEYVSHQEMTETDGITRHVPADYLFYTQSPGG